MTLDTFDAAVEQALASEDVEQLEALLEIAERELGTSGEERSSDE